MRAGPWCGALRYGALRCGVGAMRACTEHTAAMLDGSMALIMMGALRCRQI